MSRLLKQDVDDKIIIQITDTHLMHEPDAVFVDIHPEHSFHAVMQDIMQTYSDIDAIIHTGDLAQEATQYCYTRYTTYMQQFQIPFYQIPGNHDELEWFPLLALDPVPGLVSLGNWKMILLNSAVPGQVDGWIKAEQLTLLDQLLSQHQHSPILLACHHHPFAMQSAWIDQHILKNTEQLNQILAQHSHIKAVIFGHVHQESWTEWKHIQFLSSPSTSVQFKPKSDEFAFDQKAPGYRCILLKADGRFHTQVHRLQNFDQKINTEISGY